MSLAELLSLAVKWLLQLLVINVNGSVNGGIVVVCGRSLVVLVVD